MMEHHRNEVDDLDHLFKEEMDAKTRELGELLQKNSRLSEELEELKMQLELEKAKRAAEEGAKRKGKMPKRWPSKIPEEDEEDEMVETV
jgi:septal ring factor EnvC (AmiA/AmiB activator)